MIILGVRNFRVFEILEHLPYFAIQMANNKGADQTARMRRLICAFVVRKHQSQGFPHRGTGYAPKLSDICAFIVKNDNLKCIE